MQVPSETEATEPFISIALIAEGTPKRQNDGTFISAKFTKEKD